MLFELKSLYNSIIISSHNTWAKELVAIHCCSVCFCFCFLFLFLRLIFINNFAKQFNTANCYLGFLLPRWRFIWVDTNSIKINVNKKCTFFVSSFCKKWRLIHKCHVFIQINRCKNIVHCDKLFHKSETLMWIWASFATPFFSSFSFYLF